MSTLLISISFTVQFMNRCKQSYLLISLIALTNILLSGCSTSPSISNESSAIINSENQATFSQAVSAMKAGQQQKAQDLLTQLINTQPNISNAHVNLGIIFLNKKSLEQAESAFNKALNINPDNIYALNQKGILYRQLGRFSDSRSAYEKAININPDYALAHLNIGILYDLYMHDLAKAIEHYKKYQTITKDKDEKVNKWIFDLQRRYKKSLALK